MRMNIQPRFVGEKIDYIMELSKYRCSKEGGARLDLYYIFLMSISGVESSFVRFSVLSNDFRIRFNRK